MCFLSTNTFRFSFRRLRSFRNHKSIDEPCLLSRSMNFSHSQQIFALFCLRFLCIFSHDFLESLRFFCLTHNKRQINSVMLEISLCISRMVGNCSSANHVSIYTNKDLGGPRSHLVLAPIINFRVIYSLTSCQFQ